MQDLCHACKISTKVTHPTIIVPPDPTAVSEAWMDKRRIHSAQTLTSTNACTHFVDLDWCFSLAFSPRPRQRNHLDTFQFLQDWNQFITTNSRNEELVHQ